MKLLECRRLTGSNVIWNRPGAVADVALAPEDELTELVEAWQRNINEMLLAVGWPDEETQVHRSAGGVSLALSAPVDALHSAVELVEWAFDAAARELAGNAHTATTDSGSIAADFAAHAERLRSKISAERNPALLQLAAEAARRGVAFLSDDEHVSVGLGRGSKTWPANRLPDVIDWSAIHNIPVAIVTGTNGKTTTVRLAAKIFRAAQQTAGLSSTELIGVNDTIIERGDFSGPSGARTVLRQTTVDIAVLETARGGLLRRGLGVQRADAALITNIAEDHLGDFGSRTLQELLDVKWIVMRALDAKSSAVLNADDHLLVDKAAELQVPITWFSLDPQSPVLLTHIKHKGKAVSVVDGSVARFDGTTWHTLCTVAAVPVTLNGIARHNVANVLAATALTSALGIADTAIATGLKSMTAEDNPGRCNIFHINGIDVLLDFAHNPDALAAVFELARQHPAKRRLLAFAQAGDRTDELIRELARGAWASGLDHVIVSELGNYRRGRQPGEVYQLLRDELLRSGATADQISYNEHESESLAQALDWAQPGDLVIMLALEESRNLIARLKSLSS